MPKTPRDLNKLAKFIADVTVGEAMLAPEKPKNPAAVELGRLGGLKGGKARANKSKKSAFKSVCKKRPIFY